MLYQCCGKCSSHRTDRLYLYVHLPHANSLPHCELQSCWRIVVITEPLASSSVAQLANSCLRTVTMLLLLFGPTEKCQMRPWKGSVVLPLCTWNATGKSLSCMHSMVSSRMPIMCTQDYKSDWTIASETTRCQLRSDAEQRSKLCSHAMAYLGSDLALSRAQTNHAEC